MCLRARVNLLWGGLTFVWIATAAAGTWALHRYDATAGALAVAPTDWPAGASLSRTADRFTLIVFLHPRCPCSRATVDVLNELAARAGAAGLRQRLAITVCVDRPSGVGPGWERTDLWRCAAAVGGVHLIADVDGAEARRFGAVTSGQAMLYDPAGNLRFNGGLTESRGHATGDSAGMDAVLQTIGATAVLKDAAVAARAPVYGCELFADPASLPRSPRHE